MKDRFYPDTSVPENAQKRFFRRVPGSLENGTLTPLAPAGLDPAQSQLVSDSLSLGTCLVK